MIEDGNGPGQGAATQQFRGGSVPLLFFVIAYASRRGRNGEASGELAAPLQAGLSRLIQAQVAEILLASVHRHLLPNEKGCSFRTATVRMAPDRVALK